MKKMTSYTRFAAVVLSAIITNSDGISQAINTKENVSLQIDGSKRFQQIDGIGINANTRSWNGNELQPALDLLLDSMHATIWRVIVETVEKWEDINDNNDPFTFNWDYYNKLYETPKFQKAWELIHYLNQHGITDNLMINFMGPVPEWMGKATVTPSNEDEYVEMIVSFFYYAKNVKHLHFGLVSPTNESDWRKEGPELKEQPYARILKKLMERMAALDMGDVRYVAPDPASMENGIKRYIPELMKDPVIMSKIAHIGLHSYAGYYANIDSALKHSAYPKSDYWITEWNAWCKGCDDGILGEYNYDFAAKCVGFLLDLMRNGATAAMAWEGYDSYYEHHAPSPFSYWGMLAYEPKTKTYFPRKNFYAIQHVSTFVLPGSWRLSVSDPGDSLSVLAFYDTVSNRISIVGINKRHRPVIVEGTLTHLPGINNFETYYTNEIDNVRRGADVQVNGKSFNSLIPADCIFTLTGVGNENATGKRSLNPEPPDWYAGDIHVHRNCGNETLLPENNLTALMEPNNLAVISVLADMGNGEVKDSKTDLLKVNGTDAPQSRPGRIIHWDTEWHWDATYSNFGHQALGGHLVLLGLKEAHPIWEESPYKILEWARKQNAVSGFAHFQYLNDSIQRKLNCCIPIDYPVEVALGTIDFVSEDVYGSVSSNNGTYNSEAAIHAYYKLLNCGFRPGLAAGTDYPCNESEPLGTLLTYVKVKDKLSYTKWIEGIKNGKTVVSRNGHEEFLEMKINSSDEPGDEIHLKNNGTVTIDVKWTAIKELTGRIELVSNGKVVASQAGTAKPGKPLLFNGTTLPISKSGWICARRMDEHGHQTHTAPVYITVNKKPVRASADDARFFIAWIDTILKQTEPGGVWSTYFTTERGTIKERYLKARTVYRKILQESGGN
ncbi:MAG TPA: CehA/McbA family metallohydrolase [Cyclobacteriaceae bacterium]|nr:CehA/McbA family metallohydrolase [Cyclobacteriaceae bacterium]